ncbi:hypothetical protein Barb6_00697 [Bacteroidales bacterium Barb6]|nr:hypothetical protein Barb6_00697 [Bacteroidales bacterium Barb6]
MEETKASLLEGLKLFMEENSEIPDVLKGDYEIVFAFA